MSSGHTFEKLKYTAKPRPYGLESKKTNKQQAHKKKQ